MPVLQKKWLFGIGLLIFVLPIAFKQIIDVDIWWHLVNGRVFLTEGRLPNPADYYFSLLSGNVPDFRYILAGDVIFAAAFMLGGELGLQILALACLLLSCWFLIRTRDGDAHLGHFLLLCAFVLATYQLQIIRNALFGLPLLCATLWILHQAAQGSRRVLWWLPAVLTLWSFLHGTYLFGFAITSLWLLGLSLDNLRSGDQEADESRKLPPLTERFLVLMASFFGIWIQNPLTMEQVLRVLRTNNSVFVWFALFFVLAVIYALETKGRELLLKHGKHLASAILVLIGLTMLFGAARFFPPFFADEAATTRLDMQSAVLIEPEPSNSFFMRLQVALNNLVWNTANAEFASGDFTSPFDDLWLVYIWSSFLLGALALFVLIRSRVTNAAIWLPFVVTLFLALGYKRTVGFLGIYAAFLLMRLPTKSASFWPQRNAVQTWSIVALCCLFAILAGVFKVIPIGLWGSHQFGPGRAVFFAEPSEHTLAEIGDGRIFNVINNGGFLLSRWYPDRKVFIDGFFAPHRGATFGTYYNTLILGNADLPRIEQYTDAALIPLHQTSWIALYNRSKNWYPIAMNEGVMAYKYIEGFPEEVPLPRIEFSAEQAAALPAYFRPTVANRLHELVTTFIFKGRIVEAQAYHDRYANLLNVMAAYAAPAIIDDMTRNLAMAKNRYGLINDQVIRNELLYIEALTTNNQDQLFENGTNLLANRPERLDVALTLARANLGRGQQAEALKLLEHIGIDTNVSIDFWQDHRTTVADAWIGLANNAVSREQYNAALGYLIRGSLIDASRMPQNVLVRNGMDYYRRLLRKKKLDQGFALLQQMEQATPNAPHVLYSIAWHMQQFDAAGSGRESQALNYALRSADEMARLFPKEIFKVYDLVAKLYDQTNQPDQAEIYREAMKTGTVLPSARE